MCFAMSNHSVSIRRGLAPGDISQQMSFPWQTDFVDCAYEDPYVWWPAQRPINVRRNSETEYSVWARRFPSGTGEMDAVAIVRNFYRLGHVLRSIDGFLKPGAWTRNRKTRSISITSSGRRLAPRLNQKSRDHAGSRNRCGGRGWRPGWRRDSHYVGPWRELGCCR
jgi:hypothetical protein